MCTSLWGWVDEAKVSCSFCHRGAQLTLAYSWKRPAVLAAGKGRGGECCYFFCSLTFFHFPLSSLLLSFICYTISSISFSLSLRESTQNDPQWSTCLKTLSQSVIMYFFKNAYVVGTLLNCFDLVEAIQMNTNNICFYKRNQINIA